MPTVEQMEAAVHAYVAAFANQDATAAAALFADSATIEDPVGSPIKNGKAEISAFYEGAMVTGAKLTLQGPIRIAADYAAFPFQVALDWEGKHQTIDVIDTFRFNDDGKVVEMRAYFGPGDMQAG